MPARVPGLPMGGTSKLRDGKYRVRDSLGPAFPSGAELEQTGRAELPHCQWIEWMRCHAADQRRRAGRAISSGGRRPTEQRWGRQSRRCSRSLSPRPEGGGALLSQQGKTEGEPRRACCRGRFGDPRGEPRGPGGSAEAMPKSSRSCASSGEGGPRGHRFCKHRCWGSAEGPPRQWQI